MKLTLALSVVLLLVFSEPARQVWLFDDFESAEHVAAHELAWIPLGDDLLGGTSSVVLETVPRGANGSGHALRLHGSVGAAPPAFTGAWAPLDGESRPVDLRDFHGLHFFARGEGTFQAGLRSGPANAMANYMASFTPGSDWKAFEIPFEELTPRRPGSTGARFSPGEVHWLGFTTAPGARGPFHLESTTSSWVRTDLAIEPCRPLGQDRRGRFGFLSRMRRRAQRGASSLEIRPAMARSRPSPTRSPLL